MWITAFIVTLVCFSETQAGDFCEDVISECRQGGAWTGCYEDRIATCRPRGRMFGVSFVRQNVNSSKEAEVSPTPQHRVHIPSSALQKSRGAMSGDEVLLVATVLNSTYFKLSPPRKSRSSRSSMPLRIDGLVMGEFVLVVRAGSQPVTGLSQPIRLTFTQNKQEKNGTCVFWVEQSTLNGTGYWSPQGCETNNTGAEFICSCDHLSFFAVLVNPELKVDKKSATALSYITYIGSALSVFFITSSLIIYICLQQRRPEKAVSVHMQLTGALLCLHLSFLLSCIWVWQLKDDEDDWVCHGLGVVLHWSLLTTFTWMALEGFHLYLLLVRVFNIYVRRYLLKLSLVGWGLPTLIALVCGISGVYGKFNLKVEDENNPNLTAPICWISSDFNQHLVVIYITTVALPCLVILCNSCMMGLVVFKLWGVRRSGEGGGGWQKMNKEKGSRLWKDCATVLGLSWVLGLPWGLGSTTYVSLAGIYVFTILNSLQGVFMFLWSVALSCKTRSENNSSSRDPSSQKMMTTSFNN
ncbi:adhesion G protein-coupled receptor G3-like isoform X2 [Notolabrus celidotus]|uniref:adhesion G protein-coupled receptor G3-like isoform X2 n=1 Tax=Notolabrus celidotus TaxID=1203425 RepID=UPI0014903CF8|nr:adhesion G protein-coupled receptor G3-like isoform X2 [Notolabrus celidotus]